MRAAADELLRKYDNYISIDGSAEATGIESHSIDLIVCAQAFHWFNNPATQAEFKRILQPKGYVALIWNNRLVDTDGFSVAYDLLLKSGGDDYTEVNHQNLNETDFAIFYRNGKYSLTKFDNIQVFDQNGLIGRAFSSSYVPAQNTPAGEAFLEKLKDIFEQYQEDGTINFRYQTEVYLGKL
jgi:SAM-dependent methyltransferase